MFDARLRTAGSGSIVLLAQSPEQADAAAQIIRNHVRHAAWVLRRDATSSVGVPMLREGRLVAQKVHCTVIECPSVALPSLKSSPKAQPGPTSTTCPMRVIAYSPSMPGELWSSARSQPRRVLQQWAALVLPGHFRGSVQDSWSFAQQRKAGADIVTGLVRIPTSAVVPLLAEHGSLAYARPPPPDMSQRPCGMLLALPCIGLTTPFGTSSLHKPKLPIRTCCGGKCVVTRAPGGSGPPFLAVATLTSYATRTRPVFTICGSCHPPLVLLPAISVRLFHRAVPLSCIVPHSSTLTSLCLPCPSQPILRLNRQPSAKRQHSVPGKVLPGLPCIRFPGASTMQFPPDLRSSTTGGSLLLRFGPRLLRTSAALHDYAAL